MFSRYKSDRRNESCKRWKSWPQNHTAVGAGRHLWRPPGPNPCSEWAQLKQVAQGHVHSGSEYSQQWRFHHISGQLVLLSDYTYSVSRNKKFSVCAHHLLSCHWLPLRRVCLFPLHLPVRYLHTQIKRPGPPLVQAEQSQLIQPLKEVLQTLTHSGGPLLDSPQYTHVSSGDLRSGHSPPDAASPGWVKRKDHLPPPAGNALLKAAQQAMGHLCHRSALLAHGHLDAHQQLLSLCCQAAFQPSSPTACTGAWGEVQDRDQHLPRLWNMTEQFQQDAYM